MAGKKKIDLDEYKDEDVKTPEKEPEVLEDDIAIEDDIVNDAPPLAKLGSEDVLEMVDIYEEIAEHLVKSKIKATSEDVQKMAVSVFIQRNNARSFKRSSASGPVPDFKTADTMKSPSATPTNTDAKDEYKNCAKCKTPLAPKYKPGGKWPMYNCYKCKGTTWTDGTFHAWSDYKK